MYEATDVARFNKETECKNKNVQLKWKKISNITRK